MLYVYTFELSNPSLAVVPSQYFITIHAVSTIYTNVVLTSNPGSCTFIVLLS